MMKKYSILLFVIIFGSGFLAQNDDLHAQNAISPDHLSEALAHTSSSLLIRPDTTTPVDTSKKVQSLDTVLFDMYGNLRVDDPLYNKRAPWYVPALNIVGQEVLLNLADQYLLNLDWARVGLRSWGNNLRAGAPWGDRKS